MRSHIKNSIFFTKVLFLCVKSGLILHVVRLITKKNLAKNYKIRKKLGKNLAGILPKLGPAFIKLGQVLSTRSDFLGKEVADELFSLQDKLPSVLIKDVENIFQAEFGTDIESLFSFFDKKSYAAASIAQVHKAITKNGEVVAVKILRPKIEKKYNENLDFILSFSSAINFFLSKRRKIKVHEVIDTLKKASEIELDLRLEAAAAEKIKENCKRDLKLYIPKVHWQLTRKGVLTTEWIDGIPMNQKGKLIEAGLDLKDITKNLAIIFFNQACRDGFFHADIHPGNIIIKQNGDIALIDFGIVCYLGFELKIFVAEIVHGFLTKNYRKIKDIHFKTGFVPANQSEYKFELACRSIGEPIVGKALEEVSLSRLLKHLFEVSRQFSVKVHPELLLLHKTVLTMEGTGHYLNPKINMWNLASPWVKEWAKKNLGKRGRLKKFQYQQTKLINQLKHIIGIFAKKTGFQDENTQKEMGNIFFKIYSFIITGCIFFLIVLLLMVILT
jgi:ubiquinone biosynthesis protein